MPVSPCKSQGPGMPGRGLLSGVGRAAHARRFKSRRTGGVASTSPMLSNLYPTSSDEKSSAGCRSRPFRSRIVLLYSLRLRRRTVTRSGRSPSSSNALSSQELKISSPSGSGRGLILWSGPGYRGRSARAVSVLAGDQYWPPLITSPPALVTSAAINVGVDNWFKK
jgi:hypothetical protein